jgi:hypothetical protein
VPVGGLGMRAADDIAGPRIHHFVGAGPAVTRWRTSCSARRIRPASSRSHKPGWVAEAGDYQIQIGSSSRDLRLKERFHLGQTKVAK